MSTTDTTDAVLHERREAGLWLTLNRPDALNGLSPAMLDGIVEGLAAAEADPAVRAVVLTGKGRAFCAGADLKHVERVRAEHGGAGAFLDRVAVVFDRLARCPLPVIAAVPGIAAAGGFELLLCCDVVILAASARVGDAHANYGLLPGAGGSARLPRLIGAQRAKQLMFSGDLVTAEAAFALGFGNAVVPDAELAAHVEALVASFARKSPLGLARMKRLVEDGLAQPLDVAVRNELTTVLLHDGSFDQQEGIAAFTAKRAPRFEGR